MSNDTLSLGWTRARADGAINAVKRLFAIAIAVQSVAGLICLFWPGWAGARFAPQSFSADAITVWGALMLALVAFQLPAWRAPLRNRWTALTAIVVHGFLALVYLLLWGGFFWFFAIEALFAALLGLAFHRMIIAELMTRP